MKNAWWVDTKELNTEQRSVITLPIGGSYLVTGPPGCGKTNLLLLRANFLAMSGHANILIVVFTRTLQEFIRTGTKEYSFPESSVVTSHSWQKALLDEYGSDSTVNGTFAEQRVELLRRLKRMIIEKGLGQVYDAIFLDEAQDYLIEEIEVFSSLSARLFAVADSKQRIYDGEDPLERLKALTDGHYDLKFHYRCGLKICRSVDSLRRGEMSYQLLATTSQYDEALRPSTVDRMSCADLKEVANSIIQRLQLQLQAYPQELLGVIAPRREDAVAIGQLLIASAIGSKCVVQKESDYITFDHTISVCVCTIHAAKGLEFRSVHLVGSEHLPSFREKQKRITYTALSRAKTSLTIYSTDPIPGYLEQAINVANDLPDLPALDDVFKRKN